jgi:hypothetical protein
MASAPDDFPEEFTIQRVRLPAANEIAALSPAEIAAYFHAHIDIAKDLLGESYDKRWTPASFFESHDGGYRVGWFSARFEYKCIRHFSNLPDAATDYLLFSLGRGRWNPQNPAI